MANQYKEMNDIIPKFKLLQKLQSDISTFGDTSFELSKEDIVKFNILLDDVKLNFKKFFRNDFVEDIDSFLESIKISEEKSSIDAFDDSEQAYSKVKDYLDDFVKKCVFEYHAYSKGQHLQRFFYEEFSYVVKFDFDFKVLLVTVNDTDYTSTIELNDKDGKQFTNYFRAKRQVAQIIKYAKIALGFIEPEKEPEYHTALKRDSYRRDVVSIKARITSDGKYNQKDTGEIHPNIAPMTDSKAEIYAEYRKKVDEFEQWKKEIENFLLDEKAGHTMLDDSDINVDDIVYFYQNGQRLEKCQIIEKERNDDDGCSFYIYKKFLPNGNLGRKTFRFNNYDNKAEKLSHPSYYDKGFYTLEENFDNYNLPS